jgi:hypothetical protein
LLFVAYKEASSAKRACAESGKSDKDAGRDTARIGVLSEPIGQEKE